MNIPLISIIIPCYNGEKFIENAIHSCIQESYPNIEIIVMDDGSKDNSKQIIEALANQFYQIKPVFQENKGVCAARNACLEIAKGDFYIFLDADDILLPNSISHLVEIQQKQKTEVVVGLTTLQAKGELVKNDFSFFEYPNNPMASLIKRWWPVSAVMIKKNEIKWNEKMKVWEVVDYFFRILVETNFSCTFTDFYVSQINDYNNEDKITIVYNHYDPINSAKFFAALYQKLGQTDKIDYQTREAINYQLLNFIYQALQNNQRIEKYLYQSITKEQLKNAPYFKPTGLTGWVYLWGVERGMKLFLQANKIKSLLKRKK